MTHVGRSLDPEAVRYVTCAMRAFTEPPAEEPPRPPRRKALSPGRPFLVVDCETTVDEAQSLRFGFFAYCRPGEDGEWSRNRRGWIVPTTVGCFHADDLEQTEPEGMAALRRYCTRTGIPLMSRDDFIDRVLINRTWHCKSRRPLDCAIVGFNLGFDIARVAVKASPAAGAYDGGFSFVLATQRDGSENKYRPRVVVKRLDHRKSLMTFTAVDQDDDNGPSKRKGKGKGKGLPRQERRKGPIGTFVDCHTLAGALTDQSYTLAGACEAFGSRPKRHVEDEEHGAPLTARYIAYARGDVLCTADLYLRLCEELRRHPVDLAPERAMSSASLGKAYLRAVGIRGILRRQRFKREVLGWAMTSYMGARTEVMVRRVPVPVVYTDLATCYLTVNVLLGVWRLMTARTIKVVDSTHGVRRELEKVTLERVFEQENWREWMGIAEIEPDGALLPFRGMYRAAQPNIGLNHVHLEGTGLDGLWYAIPDLIAAELLSPGRIKVRRALRFVPSEPARGLRNVSIRGEVEVDPYRDDLFARLGEERARRKAKENPTREDRRLVSGLKCVGNATPYGAQAEFTPYEGDETVVHALLSGGFRARVESPEKPGEFCFPPAAACITAGARLLLTLIDRMAADLGGVVAFCDTDSAAIVSTLAGGLVPCPGGPHRTADGQEAIKALRWDEVDGIRERLRALIPFDREAVPELLNLESVNLDGAGRRRQLWCYGISPKRYVLYVQGDEPAAGVDHDQEQADDDEALELLTRDADELERDLYRARLEREAAEETWRTERDILSNVDPLYQDRAAQSLGVELSEYQERVQRHRNLATERRRLARETAALRQEERRTLGLLEVATTRVWETLEPISPGAGIPTIVKYSEHGLGHVMAPTSRGRKAVAAWRREVWDLVLRHDLLGDSSQPDWCRLPAVGSLPFNSSEWMPGIRAYNEGREYAAAIKPFGFLVKATVHDRIREPGHQRELLVQPYSTDPRRWRRDPWIDLHTGARRKAETRLLVDGRLYDGRAHPDAVLVKTFGELVTHHSQHVDVTYLAPDGTPVIPATRGLLRRMHVAPSRFVFTGKEGNRLMENAEAGTVVEDHGEVVNHYSDLRLDPWARLAVPVLRDVPPHVNLGVPERTLREWRSGRSRPTTERSPLVMEAVRLFALERLGISDGEYLERPFDACAAYLARFHPGLAGTQVEAPVTEPAAAESKGTCQRCRRPILAVLREDGRPRTRRPSAVYCGDRCQRAEAEQRRRDRRREETGRAGSATAARGLRLKATTQEVKW